jgi:PEP-CTERM putative exosortase interaction domain
MIKHAILLLAAATAITAPASATTLEVVSGPTGQRAVTLSYVGMAGQSFTAFDTNLQSVGFQWEALNPSQANLPISLSLLSGSTLSGAALFSTSFTLPSSINNRTATWFDVDVTGWNVTAGETYTLVLDTGSSARNAVVLGPEINIYTGKVLGGDAYTGGTALFENQPYSGFCQTSGLCDLNFRITATTPTAPVPEPATWAMMILGMGLVGGAMRNSRRQVSTTFA